MEGNKIYQSQKYTIIRIRYGKIFLDENKLLFLIDLLR